MRGLYAKRYDNDWNGVGRDEIARIGININRCEKWWNWNLARNELSAKSRYIDGYWRSVIILLEYINRWVMVVDLYWKEIESIWIRWRIG